MILVALFAVIFFEMVFILSILLDTPLRKMATSWLDQVKRCGLWSAAVKFLANTILFTKIQKRTTDNFILEATLIAFALFLALVIDQLHRRLSSLDGSIVCSSKRIKELEEVIAGLNLRLRHMRNQSIISAEKIKNQPPQPLCDQKVEGLEPNNKKSVHQLFTGSLNKFNVAVYIERLIMSI
ncbi:hypothetical protein ACFX2I_027353 [Malus domestica]